MRVIRVFAFLIVSIVAFNTFAVLPTRTWVSNVGDDANPCSYTAPCKTFAGAYGKTEVGGIISVEGPGSYGAITIGKSITIDGGGNYSSVHYSSGDGITVNFNANDGWGNNVVLRGLSFSSAYGGGYGVALTGTVATNVRVVDSTFTHVAVAVGGFPGAAGSSLSLENLEASNVSGTGVLVSGPAGAALHLSMNNVRIADSGSGSFNAGARINGNVNGTIADSKFQNGSQGILIEASTVHMSVARTVISENINNGVYHFQSGTTTILDGCSIFGNMVGVSNVGGVVIGFGNNAIAYNNQDVTGNPIQTIQGK